jgi:glycosyltransferase involved in cell wall biosynthesis
MNDSTPANSPVLSVVIPCFNQGEYLLDAISSVRACTDSVYEIIIVNDGSTDAMTIDLMQQLEQQGYLVINQENQGVARARNNAIEKSQGRYILALDADNKIRPDYILKGIEILDCHPDVGVVYGKPEWFGEDQRSWNIPEEFDANKLIIDNYIDACAVFRKLLWQDCSGYDPELIGLEDWDFWLSALEKGWKFHYIPEILFDYRVRSGSRLAQSFLPENRGRIVEYICLKHASLYDTHFPKMIRDREEKIGNLLDWVSNLETQHSSLLERSQSELQQTHDALVQSQSQLQQTYDVLERSQSELQQTRDTLAQSQSQLQQTNLTIEWMETSKFWKARLKFIDFRRKVKQLIVKNNSHITAQSSSKNNLISNSSSWQLNLPQFVPKQPHILLVVEETIPQCFRYRVQQKLEQLQSLNYKFNWISWRDYNKAKLLIHFCHVVIFYRVPAFPEIARTIEYAKSLNKIVFFDIDDLIFDREYYPGSKEKFKDQLSHQEYKDLVKGVSLYHEALSLCDFTIASTPALAREMEKVAGKGNSFCSRNALDKTILQFLESHSKFQRDYLSIFYGSGTKTHDADFQIVAPALSQIMEKYSNVRLTIVGYLKLPKELEDFIDRIDRVELLNDVNIYWEFLSQADINIAPLEPSLFNDCKSEIKWLEAAAFGVPSIVSPTQTYSEILEDGLAVSLARTPDEWFEKLDLLIGNPDIRERIALAAQNRVMCDYKPEVIANNLTSIINIGVEKATARGSVVRSQAKHKLLLVNVLYPPQALGGATFLLKNIIDYLQLEYSDRYEISVFTYDLNNLNSYEISEYNQDGIHVTKLSIPSQPDIDWYYQNPKTYEIFRQYLEFTQPDLIHFHCIQRLTASILEAAVHLNIPYLVTVHDAWWICDYQFMIDRHGQEVSYQQNDPLIIARYADDINSSMKRHRYLSKYLNKAKLILAVSEFQAELYRLNGFPQTKVNRNGIKLQPVLPRQLSTRKKIRLGYAGGICIHKGYYFLKEAITAANLQNCELTIIDLFMSSDRMRHENWGGTQVTFISKLSAEQMPEYFSNIDVLVAPSLWPESFGLITREAMLAGVWVVASDKGGLAEDIVPEINGNVFSPNHPSNLEAILKKIDSEPDKYKQQFSTESHQIRQIDEQVRELESLYQSIISKTI